MKKYFGLMALSLIWMNNALAANEWSTENCNDTTGGQVVTLGDKTFCKSKEKMNWWSASSWCRAMGGRIPSIQELCPNQSLTNDATCPISYASDTWSSTPYSNDTVWHAWYGNRMVGRELKQGAYAYCLRSN